MKLLKLKNFYLIGMILIFSACGGDDGPGYQEPYVPDPGNGNGELLTDDEILEKVQRQTFKYFWDFAGTNSGLAKERSQADAYGGQGSNIVTMGGSGFGLAAFPVAVERGWVTKAQAIQRLEKFLIFRSHPNLSWCILSLVFG